MSTCSTRRSTRASATPIRGPLGRDQLRQRIEARRRRRDAWLAPSDIFGAASHARRDRPLHHGDIRVGGDIRQPDLPLRSAVRRFRARAAASRCAALDGDGFVRPRCLEPDHPRRPHFARRRHRLARGRRFDRGDDRSHIGLSLRLGRPGVSADHRYLAGLAAVGARTCNDRGARTVAAKCDHRDRDPADPDRRPRDPCQYAGAARIAVYRSGEIDRHERDANCAASCSAQYARALDRAGHGTTRLYHPHRGLAVISRPRHSRAVSIVGSHAVGIGGRICPHRAMAGDFPGDVDQPRGVRNQSVRRRAARYPLPEAARLMSEVQAAATVLDVKGLQTVFFTNSGLFRAVDGVSFSVRRGETLAIVGESGCGKSGTALSIMRLVPDPPGEILRASIIPGGTRLLGLDEDKMREIRGNRISMIFQEPMTSLNPVMRIGDQITEAVRLHRAMTRKEAWKQAIEMLRLVRIAVPERRAFEYPHQLSGGMRQRAMIAMALACRPPLLIADEPTTALDVTIQAQILQLMLELQKELGMGLILITHDLGVVAQTAQRVIVMYAGKKVEEADVETLFANPKHPYTRGLMASIPAVPSLSPKADARLVEIPGMVPSLTRLPKGCAFAPRCELAIARCRAEYPPLEAQGEDHLAACWRARELVGSP